MQRKTESAVSGSWLVWGLALGLAVGAGLALWNAPRSGPQFRQWAARRIQSTTADAKSRIEAVVPTDTVAQSLAEGKEAARRRLGQPQP